VAADDAAAKKLGLRLVQDAGFDAVDAGSLADSRVYDLGSALSQQVLTAEEMRKALQRKP
jgi:predicted dinucleotide-binding enzyme